MVERVRIGHRSAAATLAIIGLALALPLVILAMVTTAWYVAAERGRLETVAQLTGEHLRERLDRDLSEMATMARTLATSPAIDAGDWVRFEAQGRALVDTTEFTVSLSHLDGRQIVNTRVAPGGAMPTIARPAIAEALAATRRPLVTPVFQSAVTGADIVLVCAPVIRGDAMTMFVSIAVRRDHFAHLIADPPLAGPFSAAFVDGPRRVVAETGTRPAAARPVREILSAGSPEASAKDGAGSLDFVHRSGISDWAVVTGVDKAALEAPLLTSLGLLAVLALALMSGGGVVAWASGRQVAAAAASLSAAAEAIGRGDPVEVAPLGIREAERIGAALTTASRTLAEQGAAIAEANARLEARVAERSRELEASRAHYQLLAENMTDVVVLRHADGRIAYISPSGRDLFGSDLSACDPRTRVHPDDLAAFDAAEAGLGPDRPSLVSLYRVRHADGRWIWIEAVNDVVTAADGEPNLISTLRDVTTRQHQADELRMARDAAELAQGKAENASRTKSELMGVMSHEIRTPLTTIKGFADLLLRTRSLSGDQARYLGLVAAATETLIGAVDDVLDYARAEAGDLRLDNRALDLPALAREAADLVRPAAEAKGLTVEVAVACDSAGFVSGDARRLRQVFLNILNDAIGTLQGGTVTLALQGPRRGESADRWRIAVTTDAGEEDGRGPRAAALDGSGLSLIVTQRLVGLMGGGRIERGTRPGETAAYRVSLVLAPAGAPPLSGAMIAGTNAGPGRAGRILVAEDNAINQEVVRAMLERAGHSVDMVESGEAAVLAVQASTYDLVLMDVAMPGMDGITATRRIRALQHPSRRVPILAMTANMMPDRVRALGEAGVSGHLGKPFDLATLSEAVSRQLSALVLMESGQAPPGPARPAIFDRQVFDGLSGRIGAAAAREAVAALVARFEDGGDPDRAVLQAIATEAGRVGFRDLAAAYERLLAIPEGGETAAARGRCRVARDLVRRVVHEIVGSTVAGPKNAGPKNAGAKVAVSKNAGARNAGVKVAAAPLPEIGPQIALL